MSQTEQIHASAAALNGKAVLIVGKSGSGKSALLLDLMARGFALIADDIVILQDQDDGVAALAPENAQGRLEVRWIGIVQARTATSARVELVIDLDQEPSGRLPEHREFAIFDKKLLKIDAKGLINIAQFIILLFSGEISVFELDK